MTNEKGLLIFCVFFILIFSFSVFSVYASDYSYIHISGSTSEYRFYYKYQHFLSVIDYNGVFAIRPHPGFDVNGWGSSLYLQPFLPNAVLKYTSIKKITAYDDKIEIIAVGNVSKATSEKYGSWNANISFSYNLDEKKINRIGNYKIDLTENLSASTGDLNLIKIASNYLDDVPLLNGSVGDTGDMEQANISTTSNYIWHPELNPGFFPGETTDNISIDVLGEYNQVDSVKQGYSRIEPAYKPSLKIELNSKQAGIPMIFGGIYDTSKRQDFWEDNIGITPLILKSSPYKNYEFDVAFESKALKDDGSNYVNVKGNQFFLDGKPFYFSGANNYYLFYKPLTQVLEVMNDTKAMNLSVLRTWGFCDGAKKEGYRFQPAPGIYDEATFQRMDKIIKEAGDRGIKLMIPFVNNWDDFGGMCQYVRWCNQTISDYTACSPFATPGSLGASAHDAFYTNNCTKDLYKKYVLYFLNRTNSLTGVKYKDEPAIFAWQLANEPRARSDNTGNILYNWIDEMAGYIKNIDSIHLLTTGEDGFYLNKSQEYGYNGYDGQDFLRHHSIPEIDFASMHMYPWSSYFSYENMLNWIEEHALDSQNILKKPVTLNEFGIKGSLRNEQMEGFYQKIEDTNVNGDLFWLLCDDNYPDYDGYCIYYPRDNTTKIIIEHANAMKNKSYINHLPTIQPILNIKANGTGIISIVVNATDEDYDNLNYYIDDARYSQNNNIFTWQTQSEDKGIYYTTIYVNDGSRTNISASFYVIVQDNKNCIIPYNGMAINNDTVFCTDIYNFPNGVYTLSNNIILDCAYSILIGNNTNTGIAVGFSDSSVKNCQIEKYDIGLWLGYGSTNDLIENNKIINDIRYGLYINYGTKHIIKNNTIGRTSNYIGLQVYNSDNNLIIYNNISYNDQGIYVNGNNNNFSYNNIFNNNRWNLANPAFGNNTALYNWWGTGNKAEIASKIFDCKTEGYSYLGCVDYVPYLCKAWPSNKTSPCLIGDVNNDCKVDIFDLAIVGKCYGQTAVGNCSIADIKVDGKIDIFDLAIVGKNYGWVC